VVALKPQKRNSGYVEFKISAGSEEDVIRWLVSLWLIDYDDFLSKHGYEYKRVGFYTDLRFLLEDKVIKSYPEVDEFYVQNYETSINHFVKELSKIYGYDLVYCASLKVGMSTSYIKDIALIVPHDFKTNSLREYRMEIDFELTLASLIRVSAMGPGYQFNVPTRVPLHSRVYDLLNVRKEAPLVGYDNLFGLYSDDQIIEVTMKMENYHSFVQVPWTPDKFYRDDFCLMKNFRSFPLCYKSLGLKPITLPNSKCGKEFSSFTMPVAQYAWFFNIYKYRYNDIENFTMHRKSDMGEYYFIEWLIKQGNPLMRSLYFRKGSYRTKGKSYRDFMIYYNPKDIMMFMVVKKDKMDIFISQCKARGMVVI
jgi:hypothetical protein